MPPKIPSIFEEGFPEDDMGLKKFRESYKAKPNKLTGKSQLNQQDIIDIKCSENYYVCKKCMGDGRDPVMTGFCRCKACDGQGLFSWIDIPLLRHDIELIEVINGVYKICKR